MSHAGVALSALFIGVACGQAHDSGDPNQALQPRGLGGSGSTSGASSDDASSGGADPSGGKDNSRTSSGKGDSSSRASTKTGSGGTSVKSGSASKPVTVAGGSADSSTGPAVATDVVFSTPSQSFKDRIEVGMTAKNGGEIRYTVDGTLPTQSSTVYPGEPIALTETTQIRAQVFADGAPGGAVASAIYIARTVDATSDIPIMFVDDYGKGQPCDKDVYVDAAVMIWEPVDGFADVDTLPTIATRAGMHVRGQSSVTFAQTPYKLEFWDENNKDRDYPVMGMPADSDWALIPPYYDRSLLRNPFTFALGKDMGMEAPRNAFAEVYIGLSGDPISEAEHRGIYWMTETIKNNKVRTNLKSLKQTDTDPAKISGGYIFKFDQMAAEEPKLTCSGSQPLAGMLFGNIGGGNQGGGELGPVGGGGDWNMATPEETSGCTMATGNYSFPTGQAGTCWLDLEVVDPDPLGAEQKTWLTEYIQKFHDSLHAEPIGDYESYIDVPSFINYFIISELTLNVDAYTKSAYYFKDRDQKLKAGPLWDYNFALGGVGAQNAAPQSASQTGWRYNGNRDVNHWYPMLTSDPKFMTQVKTRYTELRKTLLSDSAVKERIATMSAPLKNAVVRDYARWPVSSIILSTTGFYGGPTAPTWEAQVAVLQDFVLARLAWMDENLK